MLFRAPKLNLLVSCCNIEGALFRVEIGASAANVTKIVDGPTTGLSVSPDGRIIYVAEPDAVHVHDRKLRRYPMGFRAEGADLHDVRALADGSVVIAETATNRVSARTAVGDTLWQWSPLEPADATCARDLCHINSILPLGSRLLVSMFSREGLGEPWRERLDGAVVSFDLADQSGVRVLRRGIRHPHSLVRVDDEVWLCESRRKRIVRFDPGDPDGGIGVVAEIAGYARGLAVVGDTIAVGQSRSDAHFVEGLRGGESPAISAPCGIWLINRSTSERRFVAIPAKEVYDILPLSQG